jgi:copper chaperone CopZ
MKTKILSFVALFMFGALTVLAENKTEKFEVKGGDCEDCKTHIEQTVLEVDGVLQANWDMETKQIEVIFDDAKTSLEAVEIAIAKGGNDTPNQKATEEDYNNLPECCKYERE